MWIEIIVIIIIRVIHCLAAYEPIIIVPPEQYKCATFSK